jgi:5-methylcytosine-specific restriction endonuclease McrA
MADGNSSRTCAHCAARIVPRTNATNGLPSVRERKFCGTKCRQAAKDRKKAESRKASGYRKRLPIVEVSCGGCGVTVLRHAGANDAARYCSIDCYHHAIRAVGAEVAALRRIGARWADSPYTGKVSREAKALRRIAQYVERPRKTTRPCKRCGAPTVGTLEIVRCCRRCKAEAARQARQTESGKAVRRIHKAKRRAVERGLDAERIDPIKVFERDGWRCYLCGIDTPRNLRGTCDPAAPELEHVIPLAAGGQHTWANVRCACRRCNSRKGASLAA